MDESNFITVTREGFEGKAREDFLAGLTDERLVHLREEVETATEGVLARGRHQVVVLDFEYESRLQQVAVKYFRRQSGWKDRYDKKRGSKAGRSFEAAVFLQENGIGTPAPLAYFDRWKDGRLVESFYLSSYLGDFKSLKTELLKLYETNGPCADLVDLLKLVGNTMRRMHDLGFYHRDLGNQNIELLQDPSTGETEAYIIDLNRSRIREKLSMQERAQDFARLSLPSAFVVVLIKIYWDPETPEGFSSEVDKQRRRFALWQKSRRWRHPIKAIRRSRKNKNRAGTPFKDVWIWDDRSAQAAITLNRADRRACHSWRSHLKSAYSCLKAFWPVRRGYLEQMETAFKDEVVLTDRIGMSMEPTGLDFEKQIALLDELGKLPVLLRFGHHEGKAQWDKTLNYLNQLHERGHAVMVAILQDRLAIKEPESWKAFLEYLFSNFSGKVEIVEIGHVTNRLKWGIQNLRELHDLMKPAAALQVEHPEIQIIGPACIDFEPHHTVAALDSLPKGLRLGALSNHLYVDRRGAPENKQGRFGTVEKAALFKALAIHSKRSEDRFIVSEVNWPLVGTREWSPVAASYIQTGKLGSRVHVTEEQYGNYMIRFLALAICSGFVERVYWWRLVAHGFGLVDERDSDGWRQRPAFAMLKIFLQELGQSTFVEKLDTPEDVYALRFARVNDQVVLIWCNGRSFKGPWPIDFNKALDSQGQEIVPSEIGDEPVYLIQPKS